MGRRKDIYDVMSLVEKAIFTLIVLSFTTMAVAQVFLQDEKWRNYLNFASRLESQKVVINEWTEGDIPVSTDLTNVGYLSFKLEKYLSLPKAYILVNGREVKRFNSETALVQVRPGDIVEVDGTYYEKPFDISVTAVSDNITLSNKDKSLTINQDIVTISKVKFHQ